MNSRFQQKLPEEIELELKLDELSVLRSQHVDARHILQQVRDEITRFESNYNKTLGRRIAELEDLEAEIARLTGYPAEDERTESGGGQADQGRSSGQAGRQAGDEARARGGENFRSQRGPEKAGKGKLAENKEIKALYREVAKAIHPDLASSALDEAKRTELMSQANQAYEQQDRGALQDILRKTKATAAKPQASDIGSRLIQAIRDIAQEREEIKATRGMTEELRSSYVYRFKERVAAGLAQGIDLLGEMVAATELNIARARKRLAALKGERTTVPVQPVKARREINFPTDGFSGTIYLRDRDSINFSQWKKIGPAQGCLQVDADQAVRLDVKAEAGVKFAQIRNLRADDLHSLFLYEFGDEDLESIMHLTGLEELYLSGTGLTDQALDRISSLKNLKRLYLYQTVITDHGLVHLSRLPGLKGLTCSGNSITDEGLAVFQKAIPGVKTVSFPWREKKKQEAGAA
jgi:hypothetical protein